MKFLISFLVFFTITTISDANNNNKYTCPQWDVDFVGYDMLEEWISVDSWEECGILI